MCRDIVATSLLLLFVVCLLHLSCNSAHGLHLRDDDPCGNGMVCLPVRSCPPALQSVKKTSRHNLGRCGFEGRDELVCCPENDVPTTSTEMPETTTSKSVVRAPVYRKSKEACDEFSVAFAKRISFHIVDGEDAVLEEFPHMVGLGYFNPDNEQVTNWACGGTLISKNYVLTAAHCMVSRNGKPIKVRMGIIDIQGNTDPVPPVDFGISKIILHPDYSKTAKVNDIALILLNGTVQFNKYVMPACLYQKSDDPFGLIVTGWGLTEFGGESSHILQKAKLISMGVDKCNSTHFTASSDAKNILKSHICAIAEDGNKDACGGDSGGPLQVQNMVSSSIYSVVGVVSHGRGCGGSFPGVYTRVYSYLSWIEDIVWP